ncbi:MAG: IS66 family transposase [Proteobacteria bacterium]|nr:IS66 family transposase [Pseudomonadota bacterium]
MEKQISFLIHENKELKHRLSLTSENSHKPPSSDGLLKKNVSDRVISGKKPGGIIGHKGSTLLHTKNPDETIKHTTPYVCKKCGADITNIESQKIEKRQVFDVIIQPLITEHQIEVKVCKCGCRNKGEFPKNVKAYSQYGELIKTTPLFLSQNFVSYDRITDFVGIIFGMPITDSAILNMESDVASNLESYCSALKNKILSANVLNMDETGVRVNGKTCWMHTQSTENETFLEIRETRSCAEEQINGIVVHDGYSSYYKRLPDNVHSLCGAHLLRDLKALFFGQQEKDQEPWANEMHDLLKEMCHFKNVINNCKDPPNECSKKEQKKQMKKFVYRYDEIVEKGLNFHKSLEPIPRNPNSRGKTAKRRGENLVLRFKKHKQDILRFLYKTDVPFTNNLAERDIRMAKIQQKVSGCFRKVEGAKNFVTIWSYISTIKKRGNNIFAALREAVAGEPALS